MTGRVVGMLVLALVVVGAVAWLGRQAERRSEFVDDYSTHSAAPKGARGLFALMDALGHNPQRLQHDFEAIPEDGTIVSIDPARSAPNFLLALFNPGAFSDEETETLVTWVEEGGTFVLIASNEQKLPAAFGLTFHFSDVEDEDDDQEANGDTTRWPPDTVTVSRAFVHAQGMTDVDSLEIERGSPTIDLDGDKLEDASDKIHGFSPLFVDQEGRVVAAEVRVGDGRFVVVTSSFVASNTGLQRGDNALFLARTLADPRGLHFDEYHHGLSHQRGLAGYLRDSAMWIAVCQLALLIVLLAWRSQNRFGAPLPDDLAELRVAGDHLQAMSNIYRRGGHFPHALRIYMDELRRAFADYVRAPANAGDDQISRILVERGEGELAQQFDSLRNRLSEMITYPRYTERVRSYAAEIARLQKRLSPANRTGGAGTTGHKSATTPTRSTKTTAGADSGPPQATSS